MFGIPSAVHPMGMQDSNTVRNANSQLKAIKSDDGASGNRRFLLSAFLLFAAIVAVALRSIHHFGEESGFVLQLMIGLSALALVIQVHFNANRRLMREVSSALVAATYYTERLEQFSYIDPHTELFNRRFLDQLFDQQIRWINRRGKAATLLLFEVASEHHELAGEEVMAEAARLLRSNFRGSDYIVRSAPHQMVVLMPETTGDQSHFALKRLMDKVDDWNLENNYLAMVLRQQMIVCFPGSDLWEKLRGLEEKMCRSSEQITLAE